MTGEAPLHRGMITISIMMATIMQALDTTIANVALPHMQGSLNATQEQVSWVLTSYIVAAAIMTAPTGILAARFGRKKLFLICIIGFTIASMLCGVAHSLTEMVLFRILQGVFGAALVPLSQAVLLDINPPEKHGSAMALWGVGIMLGPIMGPALGGYLTENFDWRWVFYINLPIGILAAIGVLTFMPETEKTNRRFDLMGFLFLAFGIGMLQMGLDRGQNEDWFSSQEVIAEFILSGISFYLFIVHILTARHHPFLDPHMFRDRNFSASLVFIFVIGIILLATMALLPPYLEAMMDYPAIETGLVLAPRGIGTMVAMMMVGKLIGRFDARYFILFGLLLTAYSLWDMSLFTPSLPQSLIIWTGLVQGFGMGFVFVPLSTLAYSTLNPKYRNDGAAIFSLSRNIGSSIGISIMIALLARNTQVNHMELGSHLLPYGTTASTIGRLTDVVAGTGSTEAMMYLNGVVTQQAAAIAYLYDFRLMMIVVLLSIPLLFLIKGRKKGPRSPEEAMQALE